MVLGGVVVQDVCDSDYSRGYHVCAGLEVGTLYQGCAQSDVYRCVSDFAPVLRTFYLTFRGFVIVQMVSTFTSALVQVGVKEWLFAHVPDLCSPNQAQRLTCPHNQVYFTASAVWYVPFHLHFMAPRLTLSFLQGPHRT